MFGLSGKIFTSRNKPTPNEKVPAPKVTAPAPVTAPVNVSNDSEDEIIAVISAAVASMGQADGKNYRVNLSKPLKTDLQDLHGHWQAFRTILCRSDSISIIL